MPYLVSGRSGQVFRCACRPWDIVSPQQIFDRKEGSAKEVWAIVSAACAAKLAPMADSSAVALPCVRT